MYLHLKYLSRYYHISPPCFGFSRVFTGKIIKLNIKIIRFKYEIPETKQN